MQCFLVPSLKHAEKELTVAYEFPASFLPLNKTMLGHLGMEFTEVTAERCSGTIPIDARTIQPAGVAHGGALISLAETLASIGTGINIDLSTHYCVGQEINASLIRPVPAGATVEGVATVLHRGRTSMVWDVRLLNDQGKLVAICRCTIAIRPLESRP
jgi:1,4-dihydroxy-2-naphthoyl-CoA hydrolase